MQDMSKPTKTTDDFPTKQKAKLLDLRDSLIGTRRSVGKHTCLV